MQNWFTSDYHLGHEKIIEYCGRPFRDAKHMNSEIIRRHNERVKPDDTVFHIGDFCFKDGKKGLGIKAEEYIKQLNGRFVFLRGNHDKSNSLKTIIEKAVIKYSHHRICLVHYPQEVDFNYPFNFVGHVHENWKFKRIENEHGSVDAINVGVDVWKFYPHTFEEIFKYYKWWVKRGRKEI